MKRLMILTALLSWPSVSTAQGLDDLVLDCATDGLPTYFLRQGRWRVVPDFEAERPQPIDYWIAADGAPGIDDGSDFDDIEAAMNAYNPLACGDDGTSNLLLRFDGRYDAGTQTLQPGGRPTNNLNLNGDALNEQNELVRWNNVVRWIDTGESAAFAGGAQTLAVTRSLVLNVTKLVVHSDIEFNAINFDWRSRTDGCAAGPGSCHDILTVMLHEAGHFVGLGHIDCTDSTMYRFYRGNEVTTDISDNEVAGLCALYPPRDYSRSQRALGEQCDSDAECEDGLLCALEPGLGAPWGICSGPCQNNTDCQEGFICAEHPDGYTFCGPDDTGASGDVGTDPDNPNPDRVNDLCQPCTQASDCSNGVCVAVDGGAICTEACAGGVGFGCLDGFSCVATDQEFSVCVPDNPVICGGEDSRGALNELCFAAGANTDGSDFQRVCRPGLFCFGFAPICGSIAGACVVRCDAFDTPYNGRACPEPSQTCCYAVDDSGNCLETPIPGASGGCFDIRRVGESCALPENAICEEGARCIGFQGINSDRCYRDCIDNNGCEAGQDCRAFTDNCGNALSVCCDTSRGDTCLPVAEVELSEVGVACLENDDCASGLCIRVSGAQSACSRNCNPVLATECPADNADVNRDGVVDGPFECRELEEQFYCWPVNGPVLPAVSQPRVVNDGDSSGCASAQPVGWWWLLVAVGLWFRSRPRFLRSR
ncbi:MAG: matrixin family metalloprotease [Myxococcota bacterium]